VCYARNIWSSLQKGKNIIESFFSKTFHVALLWIKKETKCECNTIEAMAGPTNYVVDHTHTMDENENLQIVLYWRIGGPTYHVNNPRVLREQWPDDRVIQRKWVVRNRNDPGHRVVLWRSGWQDWVANNEDLRLVDSNYWRQLCFSFLQA